MSKPHNKIEEEYYKHDHYHCWQEKKPPCGQRIEHLKCCLCEEVNPKVFSLQDTTEEEYPSLEEVFEAQLRENNTVHKLHVQHGEDEKCPKCCQSPSGCSHEPIAYSPEVNLVRPILVKYLNEWENAMVVDLASLLSQEKERWMEEIKKAYTRL